MILFQGFVFGVRVPVSTRCSILEFYLPNEKQFINYDSLKFIPTMKFLVPYVRNSRAELVTVL